jgi:hypothetical protein
MPTTPEVAAEPRLSFRAWPPFQPDSFDGYVAVTERLSKKKSITHTYAVRRAPDLPTGAKVFHFFKQGESVPRELRVYPSGHTCTCDSGKYRAGTECRHLLAIQHLITQGVLS